MRCLQETSASVSQGPAQHQGVETELRCGQCCLDAHGLDRAVGEAWMRPPSSQLCLPPPHKLSLGWWSPGETLLRSYLGGTFCQSLLPPRHLLPSSAVADWASIENAPKSRVTQPPSSPSHLPDELLPKLLLLNPMGQTQPLVHQFPHLSVRPPSPQQSPFFPDPVALPDRVPPPGKSLTSILSYPGYLPVFTHCPPWECCVALLAAGWRLCCPAGRSWAK